MVLDGSYLTSRRRSSTPPATSHLASESPDTWRHHRTPSTPYRWRGWVGNLRCSNDSNRRTVKTSQTLSSSSIVVRTETTTSQQVSCRHRGSVTWPPGGSSGSPRQQLARSDPGGARPGPAPRARRRTPRHRPNITIVVTPSRVVHYHRLPRTRRQ